MIYNANFVINKVNSLIMKINSKPNRDPPLQRLGCKNATWLQQITELLSGPQMEEEEEQETVLLCLQQKKTNKYNVKEKHRRKKPNGKSYLGPWKIMFLPGLHLSAEL